QKDEIADQFPHSFSWVFHTLTIDFIVHPARYDPERVHYNAASRGRKTRAERRFFGPSGWPC
ncbi:hypothetical protein, partial [Ketobacter nezhaii]|uniref:hypothetical protein n=1 Tax=Ketobacter sp. MCCC 1A13808 TaxID=2602738 RepID=UPI001E61E239